MLGIRIVSGPQIGTIVSLREGTTVLGRGDTCQLVIQSSGVSKQHAKIEVLPGKVIITDLASRNGTFVNGVQIRTKSLRVGDKISLHEVLMEVVDVSQIPAPAGYHPHAFHRPQSAPPHWGSAAPQMQTEPTEEPPRLPVVDNAQKYFEMAQNYVEDVILPGVYRLPEYLEFKWVLGIFMAGFIVLVTSLSTVPLIRILKSSIERESQEHALTIAKTLAEVNAPALSQGLNTAVSVAIALKRPGVKDALIISDVDGSIIAPAAKSGSYPDIAFVHDARKRGKEAVSQIDSDTVVALAPMEFYSAETGVRAVTAYSVVVYDMGSLAVDDGKTLSLFIQTLFISLIIGGILFFFLYKIIEYPLKSMNYQLNEALKNGTSHIQIDYDFPVLESLASNVSSALSRTGQNTADGMMQNFEADRTSEMNNMLELIGFGAMAIHGKDRTVAAVNPQFTEKSRLGQESIFTAVSAISDQALKLSLLDLLDRVENQPDQIATNDLEFNGESFQLAAQAVQGTSGISYYLVVLLPMDGGSE
jgi:hypothetical protein